MSDRESCTCTLDPPAKISCESTGLSALDEQAVPSLQRRRRPLSLAWISDELLADTIELWSESYGRPISEDEAVEILMNVKRMGELLLRLRREGGDG
ncbi:MAG TPA: hypothetical protein PLV57_21780 [Phycisphaerae bacterium]|jgi:hypothetical protein|nr:hypothetical protein [Phycisphaerae bacterium]HOL26946.1 hypothetical protein [Phycisphaerae bacterium]HPP29145.1 hypothetical protein [Phycisphaerae bacterium]